MNEILSGSEWEGDVLKRKKYALFLTKYLEHKGKAFCININSPWGTGKTFFIDKWYADVKVIHPAAKFNAWENDYGNDPLMSIISCINNALQPTVFEDGRTSTQKIKFLEASGKLLKKLAPTVAKGLVGKAVGCEAAEEIFSIHDDEKEAMQDLAGELAKQLLEYEKTSDLIAKFKESITKLFDEAIKDSQLTKPLFLFIDELDRCRPSYAIELLERVKHVFDIPEVVFVIATDSQQLSHSVRAIYGNEFDGYLYLRRFFDQTYTLPESDCFGFSELLFKDFKPTVSFFKYGFSKKVISEGGGVSDYSLHLMEETILLFSIFSGYFNLDLRSQRQCFDRFVAIESGLGAIEELHFAYLIFLIMLDAKSPSEFYEFFKKL